MTVIEWKTEISKVIEKVPESALPEILNYINNRQTPSEQDLKKFIDKVFEEEDNLLRKLAQ